MSKSSPLSVTIGGRIISPNFQIVDNSPSNLIEIAFDSVLKDYTDRNVPIESKEGRATRERVMSRMGIICQQWIKSVCQKALLSPEAVKNAGGKLYTSGSYRLGVGEPGADIDTVLVAPNVCTRQDFFGSDYIPPDYNGDESTLIGVRDPSSLAEIIRRHPNVTNFNPVENAAVPILTFDWEGVNIDLLFATLNSSSVPKDFDIDNDAVLDGVDPATEKSLNGPRVTNLIAKLVSGTEERRETFLAVVRCVRKWAKARGLYSNKMGYWGGVNINIAVALVIQFYPNACPASLLRKFFLVFKYWRWPNPVILTKPHDANLGLRVWSTANNMRQVAPVITPAYPAMNSTLSVSRQTLQILIEEFCRGHDILERLWKDHQKDPQRYPDKQPGDIFQELFEPSDFFIQYPHYLSLCVVGPTNKDTLTWVGFVESRLRKLVSDLLGKSLPLSKIQLWPKKFKACVADRSALLSSAQRKNSLTYFVGFQVDRFRMRGDQLNIELQMQNFREWHLGDFKPLVNGMDVLVKCFKVKELPLICFDEMYVGGKITAMKKRRRVRDADPKRQEAKRVARYAELKAKMAEIQRKKEMLAATNERKRKREEEGNDDVDDVKCEAGGGIQAEIEATEEIVESKAEEALLESALDSIQNEAPEGGKTRKEAELDRKKLLAGELLVEGGGADDSGDEDGPGYGPDGARKVSPNVIENASLSISEREAEILRRTGYNVVSDDEKKIVGGNVVHPWRKLREISGVVKKPKKISIRFRTEFDVVELDANGYVVDKGDEDFAPSVRWTGRRPGFEFKLGERGLGFYRTGKRVVVPSNTAYS